jgi:hypothetical protein
MPRWYHRAGSSCLAALLIRPVSSAWASAKSKYADMPATLAANSLPCTHTRLPRTASAVPSGDCAMEKSGSDTRTTSPLPEARTASGVTAGRP